MAQEGKRVTTEAFVRTMVVSEAKPPRVLFVEREIQSEVMEGYPSPLNQTMLDSWNVEHFTPPVMKSETLNVSLLPKEAIYFTEIYQSQENSDSKKRTKESIR